jgi:WD40 repeat protein
MAIYLDEPRKDGLFRMHRIQPSGYTNAPGDGRLDLSAFDVEVLFDPNILRFWLLNHRPLFDSEGKIDKTRTGANTTVDVYEYRKGEKKMSHLATSWSPSTHSPNKIAFMGANNFVISNDCSPGLGFRRNLDPILGSASLVYYDDWSDRYITTPKTLPIPGQMVRGSDDRLYVPSLLDGTIRIFQLQENHTFKKVHSINLGMPIAGLSLDSTGDIWAVGRSKYDPTGLLSTNTIFKIDKYTPENYKYARTKVLEDGESKIISGASVVRHDAKTNRIFLGGK